MDWTNVNLGIFKINDYVYQGRKPTIETLNKLKEIEIDCIINVSDTPYIINGFKNYIKVLNILMQDNHEIDTETIDKIKVLALKYKDKKVFIHCLAGQNRSAVAIWIYLVFSGFTEEIAENLINENTLDAVPKHGKILTPKAIEYIRNNQ